MSVQSQRKTRQLTLPPCQHRPAPYDGPSRDEVLALRRRYLSPGLVTYYKEIAQAMTRRIHFNTFGGNPVSMIQGLATIEVIDEEGIQQNALEVGRHLKGRLVQLSDKCPLIGEVRGLGLMLGVELVRDRKSKEPADTEAAQVLELSKECGLLVGKGGLYGNTLRIKPPMCINKDDADFLVDCLEETLSLVVSPA